MVTGVGGDNLEKPDIVASETNYSPGKSSVSRDLQAKLGKVRIQDSGTSGLLQVVTEKIVTEKMFPVTMAPGQQFADSVSAGVNRCL